MNEIRFAGYRVMEPIGSGAISSLYRAVQESTGREVVIKALKSTIAPTSSFAAQIEREARVLAELSHPNIVLLVDWVKQDPAHGRSFLVLERIIGTNLRELLRKKRILRPETAAAIACEIALGLEHAHERGVVHRDVKPENVLLSARGEVKLVDFGIAQRDRMPSSNEAAVPIDDKGAVHANDAFGTPAYMSPEQILGEHVDEKSDLFSLGVVLYRMIAGVRPFDTGEEKGGKRSAAQRIRRDAPVLLRERVPDIPRPLERIVMRLIEKNPADRVESAAVLSEELAQFVRTRTKDSRARIVHRALVEAGLVKDDTRTSIRPRAESRLLPMPMSRALLGFGAIGLAFAVAGAWIQSTSWSSREALGAGSKPLELAPQGSGGLRVLATPWAEVWVDGQRVETTPFARPIPLSPGTHYVTLTHPSAPEEKRTITIAQNEIVQLEVTMQTDALKLENDRPKKAER